MYGFMSGGNNVGRQSLADVSAKATVCDWEGIADLPIGRSDSESENALGNEYYRLEFAGERQTLEPA